RGERGVCENGGVRLRASLLRLDRASVFPPDGERPCARGFSGQIRLRGRRARRGARPVDGRKESGPRLIDERQGLTEIGLVRLDRLVGYDDDPHELVEFGITKDRPPLAFWLVCAWRRDLPALNLFELRRHDRRGAFKVGADRRTPGERKRGDKRRRPRKRQE